MGPMTSLISAKRSLPPTSAGGNCLHYGLNTSKVMEAAGLNENCRRKPGSSFSTGMPARHGADDQPDIRETQSSSYLGGRKLPPLWIEYKQGNGGGGAQRKLSA